MLEVAHVFIWYLDTEAINQIAAFDNPVQHAFSMSHGMGTSFRVWD